MVQFCVFRKISNFFFILFKFTFYHMRNILLGFINFFLIFHKLELILSQIFPFLCFCSFIFIFHTEIIFQNKFLLFFIYQKLFLYNFYFFIQREFNYSFSIFFVIPKFKKKFIFEMKLIQRKNKENKINYKYCQKFPSDDLLLRWFITGRGAGERAEGF